MALVTELVSSEKDTFLKGNSLYVEAVDGGGIYEPQYELEGPLMWTRVTLNNPSTLVRKLKGHVAALAFKTAIAPLVAYWVIRYPLAVMVGIYCDYLASEPKKVKGGMTNESAACTES